MGALEMEIAETLKSLDPIRAKALESAIHQLLVVARPDKPEATEVDEKGWPIGYWEKFAGILEDDDWEIPADPPPEPVPM